MTPPATLPLHPDALDANRAGRLTDAQRAALRRFDRGPIGNHLLVAALCVVLAVVLFVSRSPAPKAWLRPFAAVVALAAAGGLVLRSLGIGGRLAHDLAAGRVESIEGAIDKGSYTSGVGASGLRTYYLEVGGRRFSVYSGPYRAAPDAGIVRLYYLPTSHHVVNLERLPDRPLPDGALASPLDALKAIAPRLRSHDSASRAEAAATLAGLENAFRVDRPAEAAAPASARDPRPLTDAIVGRWSTGPVSLEFTADGAVALHLAGGAEQHGRWHVDPSGRFHADAVGHEQIGDAWVVGDTLTITSDGRAVTFRRV